MRPQAKCCAVLVILVKSLVSGAESDDYIFEFGRKASDLPKQHEQPETEIDVFFRDLADIDELSMSMTLSMSMSMPSVGDRGSLPIPSPIETPSTETTAAPSALVTLNEIVNDQIQTLVSIPLEVETSSGTETFTREVSESLANALSNSYPSCEVFERRRRRRRLEDDAVCMKGITVIDETNSCTVLSKQASDCHHARAEVIIASPEGVLIEAPLKEAVRVVVDESKEFDDELMVAGIVDVRIRDEGNDSPRGIIGSGDDPSRNPTTTAVVSAAAASAFILAALAFRRSTRKAAPVDANEDDGAPDAEG